MDYTSPRWSSTIDVITVFNDEKSIISAAPYTSYEVNYYSDAPTHWQSPTDMQTTASDTSSILNRRLPNLLVVHLLLCFLSYLNALVPHTHSRVSVPTTITTIEYCPVCMYCNLSSHLSTVVSLASFYVQADLNFTKLCGGSAMTLNYHWTLLSSDHRST